ncbi:hypothetical protein [Bacillus salipaludis]|uniref:Uncharacterized protein n=1 Tax=Bacillus salipaludis TaxID=2547811 RepID=A0ABW8RPK6_9BACI
MFPKQTSREILMGMIRDNVLHVLIQDLFPSPEDVDFTFAWVSDTQYYSDAYPDIYRTVMN